ncbi:putative ribonuclease H-like domain-containing protein [Tanacetum coccineum]|uniref:Ribonuclease H-like domain-containing protein n=1 Tax=Tanacetum coccineum TaxID=301880 RepID=A0ABQ5IEF8_9ASTR
MKNVTCINKDTTPVEFNKNFETNHDDECKPSNRYNFIPIIDLVSERSFYEGIPLIFIIKNLYVPFGIPFDPKQFYKDGVYTRILRRPRDQRHPYLKFEGLEYTDADILDFEERLGKIYERGEVIENGDSWVLISQRTEENGITTSKVSTTATTKEKIKRKNDVKGEGCLFTHGTYNEHAVLFRLKNPNGSNVYIRDLKQVLRLGTIARSAEQQDSKEDQFRLKINQEARARFQRLWFLKIVRKVYIVKESDNSKENSDKSLLKEVESQVKSSFVKDCGCNTSKKVREVEPKKVRENNDAPIIKDWVSDDEEQDESITRPEKKTITPTATKIEKTVRKSVRTPVNIVRLRVINTARQNRTSVNATKANGFNDVKPSACWWMLKLMTSTLAYLSDFKLFDGGYVAFGGVHVGGKQHRASCKSKVLNPITKPLFMLHMDLFGPTFVSSLMHKKYCLVVTDDYSRFTWVFFLTTKDETSEILKRFIKEIENLVDKKVKIIRSDNGTEFKNKVMDDFCREKGIKREYSVARTPQQNGVAERRNRTLIEAARTMLADSKLPTTFWAEAVSTACYVQNRVLVVKPHNKTPYELFRGFKPALSFMRPFGCHVTILNTLDSLGKFDGKSDEGFFVGYSLSSKAFRVYNTRTKRVEENLHIGFLENKPMIEGTGPKWLFDIDSLTQSMNYVPVSAGTVSNISAGTSEVNSQECIVMPIWKDPSYFDSPTENVENGEPKTADDTQKQDEDGLNNENAEQERFLVNSSSKDINTVRQQVNTASLDLNTGSLELNAAGPLVSTASPYKEDSTEEEPEVDFGNITNSNIVPTTPNTRIHKDHPTDNVIGDLQSTVQTGRMLKPTSEQGFLNDILVDLPNGKKAIGTKWVFRNKKDERGIVIRNKARLVAQSHRQEEGIDYEEVFALVARIEAIRLGKIDQTLFIKKQKGDILVVQVYVDDIIFGSTNKKLCTGFEKLMKDKFQMSSMAKIFKKFNYSDVKFAATPVDLEKPLVKDGDADDVDVHLYRSMIGSLMYLTASRPDIMFAVCACARFQVTPKTSHLLAVKRIFRYLKGKPTLRLWYSRDSPFEY